MFIHVTRCEYGTINVSSCSAGTVYILAVIMQSTGAEVTTVHNTMSKTFIGGTMTDRQTDRQRQTHTQTDRQTDTETDRHTDRQTKTYRQ